MKESSMRKLKKCILLMALLTLTACGSSKSDVNPNLLNNGSSQYIWNGVTCIDSLTTQIVNTALCSQNFNNTTNNPANGTNGYYNNTGGSQCVGTYQTMSGQYVQCNGYNCSGQFLINPTTRSTQFCY